MLFDKKCPSNVIFIFNDMHNGNMKLEHFIDIGKSVPKNYLVERLNAVNKQGFPCSGHSYIPRYRYILW